MNVTGRALLFLGSQRRGLLWSPEIQFVVERGAKASLDLEPEQKFCFWPNGALEWSNGALEPRIV